MYTAAGETRLNDALYAVIAFQTGNTEAGTAGHRRMDRQDRGLVQTGSPGLFGD
jgi:hypothetical protein